MAAEADIYAIAAQYLGISYNAAMILVIILSIWALVWKGLALWRSGRRTQPIWFVILLITNTIGILPIIYLLIYRGQSQTLIAKSKKKKK